MSGRLNKPLSLAELLVPKPPRPSWIEPHFIPYSSKVLIGGEAKIGKSFTSMDLARALATGTAPFGGSSLWVPIPAKVLLCDKELGAWTLGKRAASFFQTATPEELALASKNFIAETGSPDFYFDAPHCRRALIDYLDEHQPNVMIVDPVSKFMQGSDQDNDDVRRFLEFMDILIERFAKSTRLSIVMSHHFKKPSTDFRGNKIDPGSSYNFRGGSRWYDDQDTLMTVQRHDVNERHWRLECEIETRHGQSPPTLWLDVKPESERPVLEAAKPELKNPLRDKLLR